MAMKNSGRVTVTLARKTVELLRAKKGSETWDEFLLRLARRQRCGIECVTCGKWIGTENEMISPSVLAEIAKWQEVILKSKKTKTIGFICRECSSEKK